MWLLNHCRAALCIFDELSVGTNDLLISNFGTVPTDTRLFFPVPNLIERFKETLHPERCYLFERGEFLSFYEPTSNFTVRINCISVVTRGYGAAMIYALVSYLKSLQKLEMFLTEYKLCASWEVLVYPYLSEGRWIISGLTVK